MVQPSADIDWDTRDRWLEWIKPCLPHVDIFLPSIEEATMICGKDRPEEIGAYFLNYGIKLIVLKMGERGCYIRTPDRQLRVPAYRVKVIDACGAGDAFIAGFLMGYQKGWDLDAAGRLGNACGA